jgi:hypothetical protein
MSYEVRTVQDIAAVDPAEWDALVDPDDLQASHRFVTVCQRSGVEDADYRHVLVYDGAQPVAIASFSRMDARLDLLAWRPLRALAARIRRRRPRFLRLPVAFCGLPVSFGRSCLRIRPGADRPAIVHLMAGALEAWAADTSARLLCFKEYTDGEAVVLEPLRARGYLRAASLPSARLTLRWPTLDAYVRAMRAGYRRQVRAGLEARRAQQLRVRVLEDFGPECQRLFGLYGQVMDRAEFQLERLNLEFFRRLNQDLGPASSAILVQRGDALLAAAIVLRTPHTASFLLAGIDYATNREAHAYVNAVVEVVAEAMRHGVTELDLGQTSYALKGRLGAALSGRWLFLKDRGVLRHALLRAGSGLLFPAVRVTPRRVFRSA